VLLKRLEITWEVMGLWMDWFPLKELQADASTHAL
jgi:hypothetical protein